jgi:hypothetical protein
MIRDWMSALLAPTRKSGDVRFRAAIGGIAHSRDGDQRFQAMVITDSR